MRLLKMTKEITHGHQDQGLPKDKMNLFQLL